jgi:hypothetical protein
MLITDSFETYIHLIYIYKSIPLSANYQALQKNGTAIFQKDGLTSGVCFT